MYGGGFEEEGAWGGKEGGGLKEGNAPSFSYIAELVDTPAKAWVARHNIEAEQVRTKELG